MTVYSIFGLVGALALLVSLIRYWLNRPANLIIPYLQYFVAVLFLISGFVKIVDPLGTSYKMHEYFEAFSSLGMEPVWKSLADWSTPMAVLMIVAEMVLGVMLLLGWMPKLTSWLVYLLTLFFTVLTGFTYLSGYCPNASFAAASVLVLISVLAGPFLWHSKYPSWLRYGWLVVPLAFVLLAKYTDLFFGCAFTETGMKVTDCGCFGDAIKLKPWETFWKDVFLDVIILLLVLQQHLISGFSPKERTAAVISILSIPLSLVFALYNFVWNLPVIDFRPYKIGTNIREQRVEVAPVMDYKFVYKNNKSGEEKTIGMKDFSSLNMEEWTYVSRQDVVIKEGIPAKISNLYISDENHEDITDALLEEKGFSLIVVAYKIKGTEKSSYKALRELALAADKAGVKFYGLSSQESEAEQLRHEVQAPFPFYTADETPLKTIIRSNPGLVLMKDGVVKGMWHWRHLPTWNDLQNQYLKP
jgi:uncharacterized membrane protein YphA (DoxX/SURF4 family)